MEWNDRADLETVVLMVQWQTTIDGKNYSDKVIYNFIGKVPGTFYQRFIDEFVNNWYSDNRERLKKEGIYLGSADIIPLSKVENEAKRTIICDNYSRNISNPKSIESFLLGIKNRLEKAESNGDFISKNQTQTRTPANPAQTKPAPANQAQTVPAESVPESKPKRKKASENDVLEAMDLLKARAETPNIKDWEKGTITLYLRSKGYNLELAKKTKIGKYWAIIYEQKTGTPPPHWRYSDIQKARDDLSRDGIDFDWFL